MALIALFIMYSLYFLLKHWQVGITYQSTPSMPEGYYLTYKVKSIQRENNVIFMPNQKTEKFIIQHGWLPEGIPLLKRVIGIPGDKLCIKHHMVYINNKRVAVAKLKDNKGEALPIFTYCGEIQPDYYFVQGISSPNSFDSRYYGLIKREQIISKAVKL